MCFKRGYSELMIYKLYLSSHLTQGHDPDTSGCHCHCDAMAHLINRAIDYREWQGEDSSDDAGASPKCASLHHQTSRFCSLENNCLKKTATEQNNTRVVNICHIINMLIARVLQLTRTSQERVLASQLSIISDFLNSLGEKSSNRLCFLFFLIVRLISWNPET